MRMKSTGEKTHCLELIIYGRAILLELYYIGRAIYSSYIIYGIYCVHCIDYYIQNNLFWVRWILSDDHLSSSKLSTINAPNDMKNFTIYSLWMVCKELLLLELTLTLLHILFKVNSLENSWFVFENRW